MDSGINCNEPPRAVAAARPTNYREWTADQVADWLQSLRLAKGYDYCYDIFRENIPGEILESLELGDLLQLQISSVHAKLLMSKIQHLISSTLPSTTTPFTTPSTLRLSTLPAILAPASSEQSHQDLEHFIPADPRVVTSSAPVSKDEARKMPMASVNSSQTISDMRTKTAYSSEEKSTIGAPVVTGEFTLDEVRPFDRPPPDIAQPDFVYFLSHRGRDTKEALVRPLSFILKELRVTHFFDQNDDSMHLGKENADQMAAAAWSSRVGVVVLSDRFAESTWCLRELNTFLLRRHLIITQAATARATPEAQDALLIPVYYADHLLSQSKVYYQHIGMLSSILRKSDEAAHELLVSLVPRLLAIPTIQSIPSIQFAQAQIKADGSLIKRLWNKYVNSLVDITADKLFPDVFPSTEHNELEAIKSLFKTGFKTFVPSDGLDVYQPLEYSVVPVPSVPNSVEPPKRFSLDSIILDLLKRNPIIIGKDEAKNALSSPSPTKLLLIQGAAGSGKSLFGWHLCSRYYQHPEEYVALPVFLSLPRLRAELFSDDASQLLPSCLSRIYGIKNASLLQDQPLVIILDGLDELGSKINLYQSCNLHLWRNTIFLITCRSEFLQESDVAQYITPTNPVTGTPEPSWLGKLYLLPFSAEQREEYISKFANRYKQLYSWEAQQYVSTLEKLPQLGAFLHEPLLLFMVLSVLPQIHPDHSSAASVQTNLRRLNPYILELQPVSKIRWSFPQIRQAELYALFVEGWAERQIEKLVEGWAERQMKQRERDKPTVKQVLDFCSKLAFEMFVNIQTSVTVTQAHASDSGALDLDRLTIAEALEAYEAAPVDKWAAELFAEHKKELGCSPLRKVADRYGFIHKSLQDYFTARHVAVNLVKCVLLKQKFGRDQTLSSSLDKLCISFKRMTNDHAVLRFAAELVDQRVRSYIPYSDSSSASDSKQPPENDYLSLFQPYGRSLFDILHTNRHPVASCNAISILNAAGVGFQTRDFSRLDLSSDVFQLNPSSVSSTAQNQWKTAFSTLNPLADLSGANLSGCKLVDANLLGVRLENACLDYADIRGAAMEQTIFGQSSMFLGHTASVISLLVTPDGCSLFSASNDKTVRQWSIDSGACIRVFEGHSGEARGLALSRDGKTLFSCSCDKTIRQWDVETSSVIRVLEGHTSWVTTVILSRDDQVLFSCSGDQTIRLWSVETGSPPRIFRGHTDFVWCLALSVDARTLYSGSEDKTIREWSIDTGSELRVFEGHVDRVASLVLSFDSKTLFSASSDQTIREWSLRTGTARIFKGHSQAVTSLCLSCDGKSLFSGGAGNQLFQWSVVGGSFVRLFEGHLHVVYGIALSVDGATLFSGSADKTIRRWSIDVGPLARVSEGHTDYVYTLALNHSSKRLYSGAQDRTIREWCCETGTLIRVLEGHKDVVWSLVLSSDGQTLYSGFEDSSIGLWSVASGSLLHRFQGHTAKVHSVILSGDNKIIFSGSFDHTIRSWSVSTLSLIRVFQDHEDRIYSLAVSSDGKVLFSGSKDKTIRQWRTDTASVARILKGHNDVVRALALSSDCQLLYSGSDDTTIRRWILEDGSVSVFDNGSAVNAIVLSVDDKKLFSGADDKKIRVWSVKTGTVDYVLEGHSDLILSLVLSPGTQTLFSCSHDRSVREWSLPSLPSSGLQLWNSGPWSLSVHLCQLDDSTRLDPRSRLLLTQLSNVVTPA